MANNFRTGLSRRLFVSTGLAAAAAFGALPAQALTAGEAEALIGKVVGDINTIINSGRSEGQMYAEFEKLFARYADVPTVAISVLGPAARTASNEQKQAFIRAYQRYVSHKYGRRFREMIGADIKVTGVRPIKNYFEVTSIAYLKGEQPFEVRWDVSDRGGRQLFFNIIIEGVNMLASERTEIGAMLDRRGGSIDRLTADMMNM